MVRNVVKILLLLALGLSARLPAVQAATYYVDFTAGVDTNNGTSTSTPWKRVKGMTGCTSTCSSTTLVGNDIVVFKGGTTWTAFYPWTLSGGSAGNHITYTVDQAWFTGGAWTQPVFDAENSNPGGAGVITSSASYITINNLKFIDGATASVGNDTKYFIFSNSSNLTLTNNSFSAECWITIYLYFGASGTKSNFTVTGNDFTHTSGGIWIGNDSAGSVIDNFVYNNNTFHDFSTQVGGTVPNDVHGDGALHYFSLPGSDATQYVSNMQFCNNRFYGDFRRSWGADGAMTAFFFIEGSLDVVMCNNVFSYSPAQASMFQSMIVIEGESNTRNATWQVYNNSFTAIGTSAMSNSFDVIGLMAGSTITFKNNIMYSPHYCIFLEDSNSVTAWTSNYNMYTCDNFFAPTSKTYSTWQALGFDANGVLPGNPSWTSAPGNEHISAGSAAENVGENLTGLGITILNSDRDGVARPAGGAWDMGAYEVPGGSPSIIKRIQNIFSRIRRGETGPDEVLPED